MTKVHQIDNERHIVLKEPIWHALARLALLQPGILLVAWCVAVPVTMTGIGSVGDITVAFWLGLTYACAKRKVLLVGREGISEVQIPLSLRPPKERISVKLMASPAEVMRVADRHGLFWRIISFELACGKRDIQFVYRGVDGSEGLSRRVIETIGG